MIKSFLVGLILILSASKLLAADKSGNTAATEALKQTAIPAATAAHEQTANPDTKSFSDTTHLGDKVENKEPIHETASPPDARVKPTRAGAKRDPLKKAIE